MSIGTDAPSADTLARIPHYFIHTLELDAPYSAAQYEHEAMDILRSLFRSHSVLIMVGGSMLYIDAILKGLDTIPEVSPEVSERVSGIAEEGGVESVRACLKELDPDYLRSVDPSNLRRLSRALAVTLSTGRPFSSFHSSTRSRRPFRIIPIGINADREILRARIRQRVDRMLEQGLVEEVRSLMPYRDLNALHTVGYTETFEYLNGKISIDECRQKIFKHTWVYAKQQLRWFTKEPEIKWFAPEDYDEIRRYLSDLSSEV